MKQALCIQLNIPFVYLDEMNLNLDLSRLLNKKYTYNRNIVPISNVDGTLTLAMDDPTDNEVINELRAFTGLTINVVTSSRAAILRAFGRLYEGNKIGEKSFSAPRFVVEEFEENISSPNAKGSQKARKADELVAQIISVRDQTVSVRYPS